jgi:hypothetical protein
MQGRISDFSIPDIFQLVSSQGKSGSLAIRGDGSEIIFLFSDGKIVDVHPDQRRPHAMLGNMLVDAGHLSPEELKRILASQSKSEKKIGEILVEQGKISRENLNRYLYLQVKESLYFALRIKDGDYKFEGFAVRPQPYTAEPIRSDFLMMEGVQFLDEYDMFRAKLPQGKFQVARKKGEKINPSILPEDERAVWNAIDFSTDPWRVFRKACVTWFEGVKALCQLQERGLVKATAVTQEPEDASRRIREELVVKGRIGRVRAALWGVAAVAALWWVYAMLLSPLAARAFSEWAAFFQG